MGKIKKFAAINIRKITGGKDPVRLVEEFILRLGFDPDQALKERSQEHARWMLHVSEGEDLEVLVEGLKKPQETTVYMGVNIAAVPIRGAYDLLAAALEIADGLIGIKVSLVGHFLVLSASMGAAGLSVEELEYNYRLIAAQQSWFRDALADELGWEALPDS
ncbi:MAG: hypothetical protein J5J00_12425 [Deltaproteobacteria bacterium]|nr:hypothetical protein [Deltaproteobacteria bacterium]